MAKCEYDPTNDTGGMFHCPICGEMIVAGVPHPDYDILDDPNLEIPEVKSNHIVDTRGIKPTYVDWIISNLDNLEDEPVFKMDGFDECVVGAVFDPPRLVYSEDKVIKHLISDGMTYDEAVEYYFFNIKGAYVGEGTPIFLVYEKEEYEDEIR